MCADVASAAVGVAIDAPAREGEANDALLEFLAQVGPSACAQCTGAQCLSPSTALGPRKEPQSYAVLYCSTAVL